MPKQVGVVLGFPGAFSVELQGLRGGSLCLEPSPKSGAEAKAGSFIEKHIGIFAAVFEAYIKFWQQTGFTRSPVSEQKDLFAVHIPIAVLAAPDLVFLVRQFSQPGGALIIAAVLSSSQLCKDFPVAIGQLLGFEAKIIMLSGIALFTQQQFFALRVSYAAEQLLPRGLLCRQIDVDPVVYLLQVLGGKNRLSIVRVFQGNAHGYIVEFQVEVSAAQDAIAFQFSKGDGCLELSRLWQLQWRPEQLEGFQRLGHIIHGAEEALPLLRKEREFGLDGALLLTQVADGAFASDLQLSIQDFLLQVSQRHLPEMRRQVQRGFLQFLEIGSGMCGAAARHAGHLLASLVQVIAFSDCIKAPVLD